MTYTFISLFSSLISIVAIIVANDRYDIAGVVCQHIL